MTEQPTAALAMVSGCAGWAALVVLVALIERLTRGRED